jgi:hypothetical protein
MNDFLSFKTKIAPSILKLLFWILLAFCILSGIVLILSSFGVYGSSGWNFLLGLVLILLGPFILRIVFEALITLFEIHDDLQELKKKQTKKSGKK